jgi:hypothetical protein
LEEPIYQPSTKSKVKGNNKVESQPAINSFKNINSKSGPNEKDKEKDKNVSLSVNIDKNKLGLKLK